MENIKARTTVSKKHIRPLGVSNLYDSPSGKLIVIVFDIASNVPINVIIQNIAVGRKSIGSSYNYYPHAKEYLQEELGV